MEKSMSYEKFETIMSTLQEYREKRRRIGEFFEKELMEDSWCFVTLGTKLEDIIMELLADEFDCWFEWKNGIKSNDFEWWTYEAPSIKTLTVNDKEYDVTTLKGFYDYLIDNKEAKNG